MAERRSGSLARRTRTCPPRMADQRIRQASMRLTLGQQLAAESPPSPVSSHQISTVAAAITTPVTNAAKHENSRRSFSTPVMAASPKMRASHVGVSSPGDRSALPYRGRKVAGFSYSNTGAPILTGRRGALGSAPFSTSSRTQRELAFFVAGDDPAESKVLRERRMTRSATYPASQKIGLD
jgi:hypothetical protein